METPLPERSGPVTGAGDGRIGVPSPRSFPPAWKHDIKSPLSFDRGLCRWFCYRIPSAMAWACRQSSAALNAWVWVMAVSVRSRQSRISCGKKG